MRLLHSSLFYLKKWLEYIIFEDKESRFYTDYNSHIFRISKSNKLLRFFLFGFSESVRSKRHLRQSGFWNKVWSPLASRSPWKHGSGQVKYSGRQRRFRGTFCFWTSFWRTPMEGEGGECCGCTRQATAPSLTWEARTETKGRRGTAGRLVLLVLLGRINGSCGWIFLHLIWKQNSFF